MAKMYNFNINVIQWNAQSLKPKLTDFEMLLNRESIHIAILSETWLEPGSSLKLSGYNIYRQDRMDCYGGVAIVCHKSLRTIRTSLAISNAGIEIVCIKILNCKLLHYIVSIYCPSTVRTSQTDWNEIFSIFPKNTLVAGDFNGHHSNWSNRIDTRGNQLFDSSLDNSYVSLNNGKITRLRLVNGILQESSPDISFCSDDIALNTEWDVTNESLSSDHLIIKISIKYEDSLHYTTMRNFNQADWPKYKDILEGLLLQINRTHVTAQDLYDSFLCKINEAVEQCIPYKKMCINPARKFVPKIYWNIELSKAVAERRLALKQFRRNPTPQNLSLLKLKISEAQRSIRRAKSQSFHNFCNSINESTSSTEMWRKMRCMKGSKQAKSFSSDHSKQELLYSLTPDYVTDPPRTFASSNPKLDSDFSLGEMENCLKGKDTSPGNDGISYSMIYNLPDVGKHILLQLYNLIFNSGFVPIQWREIQIVPIPKHNSNLNSKLRPIALMSCLCKTFHLMLARRLEWFAEHNGILSPNTLGFRRGQSCLDCLVRLVSSIQIGFSENTLTIACFLDIEGAYNNISVHKVISTLDGLHVGSRICSYLWHFLKERHLRINCYERDDKVLTRWTNRGIAQGDPISPLLFNIATIGICHNINQVYICQYADDFVLFTRSNRLENSVSSIQLALNCLVNLLDDLDLELSAIKSKYCTFSRARRSQHIKIYVKNTLLNSVDSIKYLGFWLDRSLRWSKHINEICEKSLKLLCPLKVLAGSSWGIHPTHLRRIYIATIRSRLDYGSYLYDNAANVHMAKLDRLQNQALRVIGGFLKSTPIHTMESEMAIPPLSIRRLYLSYKHCLKIYSLHNNINIKLLGKLNSLLNNRFWNNKKKPLLATCYNDVKEQTVYSSIPLEMFSLEFWMSSINLKNIVNPNLDCVTSPKSQYSDYNTLKTDILSELHHKYNNYYTIYTDGSKSPDGLGAAFYDPLCKHRKLYKIENKFISIMTAELLAISQALTYAFGLGVHKLVILTDSQSALLHIKRCALGKIGSSIAYKILNSINYAYNSNINISLQWIPSHIGLLGNEEADRLANKAFSEGEEVSVTPKYSEVLHNYKLKCYQVFKEYFDERSKTKGIWYKCIQCEPLHVPWFTALNINRKLIISACRLRTGHIPNKSFAHLMKKVSSPNCDECGKPDDVYHLLMECVRYADKRDQLVDKFKFNFNNVGIVHSILAEPNSDAARMLYTFLNDT